jgi:hypothetical protein
MCYMVKWLVGLMEENKSGLRDTFCCFLNPETELYYYSDIGDIQHTATQ